MVNKEQAIIDFLMQCDKISENPLFFNFINAKDDNKQLVTMTNDKSTEKPFIDGSVMKQYTFTLIDFRSVSYNPLVMALGITNENVDEFLDVKSVIEWVKEQDKLKNYPDFGEDCKIENMEALSENPNLNGVDVSLKPALAKYSMAIRINYLDTSEVIWNK